RNQDTFRAQIEINVCVGQLGVNDPATNSERSAGEIAVELLQGHGVVVKNQARLKSAQRWQCRVGEARLVNGDVAAAGEGRARNRSANGDIERNVSVRSEEHTSELQSLAYLVC